MSHLFRCTAVSLGMVAGLFFWSANAQAVPRMSLAAGTPCSACHVNGQGGGGRTEIGWGAAALTGAWIPEKFEEQESNLLWNSRLSFGADVRLQMARMGRPDRQTDTMPERRMIPMQLQPHAAAYLTDWLTLYASYNIDAATMRGEALCDPVYAGQACQEVVVKVQPSHALPTIRMGMLQPSIGVRHDDHTILLRGDAATPRQPIIAPNYAELGADLSYAPAWWFQADAGVYQSANLARAVVHDAAVKNSDVAWLGRVQFNPRLDDYKLVSSLGASVYGAGSWHMESYFVGLGRMDAASVMLEASRSDFGDALDRGTLNFMGRVDVPVREWLVASARYEHATSQRDGEAFLTRQAVLGLEFFPIPYVELRPEYRYVHTDRYAMAQYTMQLHLFY